MQVISLNILGGAIYEPLKDFIIKQAPGTDFFCFQEVYSSAKPEIHKSGLRTNILADLQQWLPEFDAHFEILEDNFPRPDITSGMVIFARKGIPIKSTGKVFIHDAKTSNVDESEPPGYIHYVRLDSACLAHFHGLVFPGSKVDTPERLDQSRQINKFLAGEAGQKILCGDFNLDRDTESVALIEQAGMRNLVKEFHVMTTRSEINYARFPAHDRQYFADYVFVSPDVKVEEFEFPIVNVSDHLPLRLKF